MSFASSHGFQHLTSSLKFPQSNGQTERSVQTIKNLLKKSDDLYTSLLSYRATSLSWCDLSSVELSMGSRLRTSIPKTDKMLIPLCSYLKTFREVDKNQKVKQKEKQEDLRHRAKDLPAIPDNTEVCITIDSGLVSGRVISPADRPRSYVVETPSGQIELS